jgi:hypothetical protein
MSQQHSKNAYGGKKAGGGAPYFVDMFQPPMNELCLIRLVPGDYLQDQVIERPSPTNPAEIEHHVAQVLMPYIKFVDHFDGARQKGGICSGGALMNIKNKRLPCHGCDIYWATAARQPNGRFESTRMSRQNKYAFSVFDYSLYHKLEQYDQATGQVRASSAGVPYYNWVRCLHAGSWAPGSMPPPAQRTCDPCRAGVESKQGHMSHWPINYTQLQSLRAAESNIGQSCTVCSTENSIHSLGWMCGACGEGVVDMSTTQLKKDEILKLTDELYPCGRCHNTSFLTEVYECRACSPRGQTGVRATLFEVDLKVMLAPGGANNSKMLQVSGWSAPHGILPAFVEAAKPIDLIARYAPDSLEKQASKFGVVPGVPMQPQRQPQTAPSNPQQQQFQQQYAPQQQQQFQQPQFQQPAPQQMLPQPPQQQFQPVPQQLPAQQSFQPQPGQQPAQQYANPYAPKP